MLETQKSPVYPKTTPADQLSRFDVRSLRGLPDLFVSIPAESGVQLHARIEFNQLLAEFHSSQHLADQY